MNHVSVVICAYNHEHYLAAAIDSALAQDYPAMPVMTIDDGSTDGSRAVIEQYGTGVSAIYKENGGQVSAHNVTDGAGAPTGAFVPDTEPSADGGKLLKSGWLNPSPPASGNA
jgi:cellulose synthase/poly-beta-1,6-N-acetylglucosamine synthase-like glycosyltransferase